MKVLMIIDNLIRGGKERRLVELLLFFASRNELQIELVLLSDQIEYKEVYDIKNLNIHILKRSIKKDPLIFYRIHKLIKSTGPDLIHSWGSMPSVYSFISAKILGIPFLNAMITNATQKPFTKDRRRAWITFPFSDMILSNSYAGLDAYKVKPDKGRVVHNGFNPERLKLKNTSLPEQIEPFRNIRALRIGMIGAFHPRKDYTLFLKVADKLTHEREDLIFFAVGGGSQMSHFRSEYRNNKKIVFTGQMIQVESLIHFLDIGILLTDPMQHKEGVSNAIMEMMAFGKPVIATRDGGTEELIIHDENGVLVEPGSEESFEEALRKLINDGALSMTLGMNARKRILNDFSIEAMGHNILELYMELISVRKV